MSVRGITMAWRLVVVVAAILAALALFWDGAEAHLRMACMVMDTPYLPFCPEEPSSVDQLRADLRERITRNPGDSEAWVQLLLAESDPLDVQGGDDAQEERDVQDKEDFRVARSVLTAAAALAPGDPSVLIRRAAAALEQNDIQTAVPLLIDSIRYRGSSAAAQALARILSTPEGAELLRRYIPSASQWLPAVLASMRAAETPPPAALTLVTEAQKRGELPDRDWRSYMRALKRGGYWVDAYGLWLASRKGPVPLLYNGSFDESFERDGFGWDFPPEPRSRAGVLLEQDAVARRGSVLSLQFTGRHVTSPILRQYVFAAPGDYRFQGEYMSTRLRSEQALVWTVVCTDAEKTEIGRSEPIQDTGGLWKKVEVRFSIPSDCGPVVSVQLQPAVPYEGTLGMHGEVALDAFSLTHAVLP